MNTTLIIGNLTADPESRQVRLSDGNTVNVCSFTVAVNQNFGGREDTTYFRVSAWRQLGESCQRYLAKGRKVHVSGTVKPSAYINQQGQAVGSLELNAQTVEFLSPNPNGQNGQTAANAPARPAAQPMPAANQPAVVPNYGVGQPADPNGGFQPIETDELPF